MNALAPHMEYVIGFFGLLVGSFLNVCVYRLPRNQSVIFPPSRCTRCKKTIAWWDNIPVVSYLMLGGRCRHCRNPISLRYPLVELTTAVLFLWVAFRFPFDWTLPFLLYYSAVMLVVTLTDYDLQLIPDSLTLPGILVGFLYLGVAQGEWANSLLGILAGGGSLLLISEVYLKVRKREGMGGGDVKLAAMMGAFLGWKVIFLVLFLSSLAGGVFGILLLLVSRKGGGYAFPFGVFLAPIGFLALLYGNIWFDWYLRTVLIQP